MIHKARASVVLVAGLLSTVLLAADAGQSTHRKYITEIVRIAPPQNWSWPTLQSKALHYSMLPTGSKHELRNGVHIAVIGDSFAHPMAGVFNKIAKENGVNIMLAKSATCAPFFDKVSLDTTTAFDNSAKGSRRCKEDVRPAMLALLKASGAQVVVLNGNWAGTFQIWKAFKNPSVGTSLQRTVDIIRESGVKVLVMGMVPGSHYDVPLCHLRHAPGHEECPGTTPIKNLVSPPHTAETAKKQLSRNRMRQTLARIFREDFKQFPTEVALVDPFDAMCTETECVTTLKNESLYYDDHHLAANATLLLQPDIEKALHTLQVKEFW